MGVVDPRGCAFFRYLAKAILEQGIQDGYLFDDGVPKAGNLDFEWLGKHD